MANPFKSPPPASQSTSAWAAMRAEDEEKSGSKFGGSSNKSGRTPQALEGIELLKSGKAVALKFGKSGSPKPATFTLSPDERLLKWTSSGLSNVLLKTRHVTLSQTKRLLIGKKSTTYQRAEGEGKQEGWRCARPELSISLHFAGTGGDDREILEVNFESDSACALWIAALRALVPPTALPAPPPPPPPKPPQQAAPSYQAAAAAATSDPWGAAAGGGGGGGDSAFSFMNSGGGGGGGGGAALGRDSSASIDSLFGSAPNIHVSDSLFAGSAPINNKPAYTAPPPPLQAPQPVDLSDPMGLPNPHDSNRRSSEALVGDPIDTLFGRSSAAPSMAAVAAIDDLFSSSGAPQLTPTQAPPPTMPPSGSDAWAASLLDQADADIAAGFGAGQGGTPQTGTAGSCRFSAGGTLDPALFGGMTLTPQTPQGGENPFG